MPRSIGDKQGENDYVNDSRDRVVAFAVSEVYYVVAGSGSRSAFVGATIYRRRPPATSGLTQQRSGSPVRPAIRLSAAISAIPLRLLTDALAIWGTMTAFGSVSSSLVASLASPLRGGSGSVTSRPAAEVMPSFRAVTKSALT